VERFVVPLVLIAVTVAADAAFAKGGPLNLFTSRASPPTISQPVSPSDFRGCGRGRYRDLVRKSVEASSFRVGHRTPRVILRWWLREPDVGLRRRAFVLSL
jgi:hypothetical protein